MLVMGKNQWKSSNLSTLRQENDMIALHEDKFNCVPAICLRTAGPRLKDQRGQTQRGCSAEVTRQTRHSLHSPCGD